MARLIGTLLTLVVHGWLMQSSGLFLTHALLVAALPLLWGERPTGDATTRTPFGVDCVLATALLLLLATYSSASAAQQLLSDTGLLPQASGRHPTQRWTRVWAERDDGVRLPIANALPLDDPHTRALLSYLDAPNAASKAFKDDLAQRLAQRYCAHANASGRSAVLWLGAALQREKLAWFTCGKPGVLPETLRLQQDKTVVSSGMTPREHTNPT
jgi:hypothetical protein